MRSGINEFRNNRNFLSAEHYEEYYDGSLMKKIVNDNGYGLKKMIQTGQRLDVDKIASDICKKTDENGFFQCFIDTEGKQYNSLKELIEKAPEFLSWEYENETLEDIAKGVVTVTRKGKDFVNNEEWHNFKTYDHNTQVEKVVNKASDAEGEWQEMWDKVQLERWCEKSGRRGAHEWKEKWY